MISAPSFRAFLIICVSMGVVWIEWFHPSLLLCTKCRNFSVRRQFPQFFNVSAKRFPRELEIVEPLSANVWGDGLQRATAGRLSQFYVGLPCTPRECGEIYVWFQGPSIFIPQNITRNSTTATVEYVTNDSGKYEIFVDVFTNFWAVKQNVSMMRVRGSPFTLIVSKKNGRNEDHVSIPTRICHDASWRTGRWLPCAGAGVDCPRTGWSWVPHDCHFPYYDPTTLRAISKPLWIVIAGSSVHRGTFFSLVDSMLGPQAARNLTHSSFWKCWGWMDLTQGNVRVSYLDFRNNYLFDINPNIARRVDPAYLPRAIKGIQHLSRENNNRGPDVFYLQMHTERAEFEDLPVIRSWFGLHWTGNFLVHIQKPPFGLPNYSRAVFQKSKVIEEIEAHPELGIQYIDEQHMALPFWHTMENDPFKGPQHHLSLHYHRACNVSGMHSCSAVSDMAVQQMLHVAFHTMSMPSRSSGGVNHSENKAAPFKFCLDCPPVLMAFTVNATGISRAKCLNVLPRDRL